MSEKIEHSTKKKVFQRRLLNNGWTPSVIDILELDRIDDVAFGKGRDRILVDEVGFFLWVDGVRVAGWAWGTMTLKALQASAWEFPNGFVYTP